MRGKLSRDTKEELVAVLVISRSSGRNRSGSRISGRPRKTGCGTQLYTNLCMYVCMYLILFL